jgi:quercetin dioxygenase-like cupin family protein
MGNFEPSAYKTDDVEVCFKVHPKGEKWPKHYHKIATEINYLLHGKMVVQGDTLNAGDVFIIPPQEVADPEFLEDCELIVVKIPFAKNDKYDII